jgi:glycosyltransferase involved in cell wall biosynthesis
MKILVIASRFPWPLEKGDKLRLYQQIKYLSQQHEVHLFALTHQLVSAKDQLEVKNLGINITLFKISFLKLVWNLIRGFLQGLPPSVAYFTDNRAKKLLAALAQELQPTLIFGQLVRTGEYLKLLPYPKVLDYMDAFSFISKQQALKSPILLRPFYKLEANRIANYEQEIAQFTHLQIFISERDRIHLDPQKKWPALVVQNGIDLTFFHPDKTVEPTFDLGFVGNLGYFPNIKAAHYLVERIMPLLWKSNPDIKLLLAGARPNRQLKKLASDRVTVSEWLPDIRVAYQSCKLFVAPLFDGAGQQNKILEAMAMGIPVITTDHVNEGIGAPPSKVLLIANDPDEFALAILDLLQNNPKRMLLIDEGLKFVTNNFNWSVNTSRLEEEGLSYLEKNIL